MQREELPVMTTGLERIAVKARCEPKLRFTSLAHHITTERVWENLSQIPAKSAAGVDGQIVAEAKESFEEWIAGMLQSVHREGYRAPEIRRVYIPKPGKQEMRPLGVPTVADRALQRSASQVLSAIYEQDFLSCSFGGRTGRGAHQALATLHERIAGGKIEWVLEADIKNFFGSLSHEWMLRFVEHRVGDQQRLRRRSPSQVVMSIILSGHPTGGKSHSRTTRPCREWIPPGDRLSRFATAMALLAGRGSKFIVATNANAAFVQSGQLLFMRGNVLMALQFDLRSLTLGGEPRPVADHIEREQNSAFPSANFSASPGGVLVWHRNTQSSQSSLQWFDRSGKRLGVVGEAAEYSNPTLSPDESKLFVGIRDPQTKTRDIWIFDLLRGTRTRLTFDPADDLNSVWSPDGTRIAFTSDRLGRRGIYQKPADGSSSEELLLGGKDGAKIRRGLVTGWQVSYL
jgi:Reverse transcriptase (RNA-dependent DNA polymerase)/WD40-like Beta Propeller Repeat